MKPKKGMTAQRIVKKLEDGLKYYSQMKEKNWRQKNTAGWVACEHKRLYIEVLLNEIAE